MSNRDGHLELIADLQTRLERVRAGGGERSRERHVARGKLLPRDRVERLCDPGAPFLELQRAGRRGALRRRRARRRDRSPASAVVHGRRGRRRRQRRDGQGRHLLPDDGQEAPARAGDRAAQPAAVRLPRRLGRRVPADAGRGLPRPRALRPDLLQPGDDVRAGHPADRVRHGLVHGRRRVRPGDERRDGDRPRAGHDLPRRPAAREGGDRRGGDGRGARRRRRPRAHVRRRRPPRRRRRPRARDRAPDRRHAAARSRPRRGSAARRAIRRQDPDGLLDLVPLDTRTPYDVRELLRADRRRRRAAGVQGALRRRRSSARSRTSTATRSAIDRQQRDPVQRVGAEGARTSSSCATAAASRCCSSRTSPASWSAATTRPAGSPRTGRSW